MVVLYLPSIEDVHDWWNNDDHEVLGIRSRLGYTWVEMSRDMISQMPTLLARDIEIS